ncbi:alkaline phosphatase D family protein [Hyphomonas atlantica]|uniref:alkaline phosphatase D family protein n=1 Tax=Hyphomonas atlantica TaxID=1280948 RepID=UPI0023F2EB00|nr:alkaline phosphatase D family protein [Hyphomonas atlantica]
MSPLQNISKRTLLKAIAASSFLTPELQALAQHGNYPKLLLGPMLGPPTPTSVSLWAMVNGVYDVVIEYADNDVFQNPIRTEPLRATQDNLYIVRPVIEGLSPATNYWYRFIVNGRGQEGGYPLPMGRFKTAPGLGRAQDFTVGYGSCANFGYDQVQAVWKAVSANLPDLFFNLGDNIYCDSFEPFVLDFEYQRQRGVHNYQHVARNIPQLAIWDDHDFGLNDHDRTNPIKENALAAFKRYWMNPSYGLPETPGVFFSYQYSAVDFIFTDGRYYRDPNSDEDTPEKTMLGKVQLEWLKSQLKASKSVFKILACGSGWSKNKGPGGDAWSAFLHERNELFDFIRDEEIEGVILISGDTHIGEFNCIPWSEHGGYDLYDLVSSPISSRQSHSWLKREPEIRLRTPPYTIGPNVGFMNFDFADEPSMTWWLSKPDGKPTWPPATFKLSQLKNGVSSWRSFMQT